MLCIRRTQAAKWIAGLAVISLLTLPGCAKTTPEAEPTEAVLTAQELLSRSGITMQIPPQARITQWLISTDNIGNGYPEVNFILDNISWSYGTQHTEKTAPYHFTRTEEDLEPISFEIEDVSCIAVRTAEGVWAGWVEQGICHNLNSREGTLDDAIETMRHILALERPDLAESAEFESYLNLQGSHANQFKGIWKYDDADEWLYIWDNMTYTTAGADRQPDKRIRFARMENGSHNTMRLYNHTDGKILFLIAAQEEESETVFLTDSNGRTLHDDNTCMNGVYYCYLGNWSLDGTTDMWLTKILDLWLSSSEVNDLVPGGVLHFDDVMIADVPLETVEHKEEGWIVLNGTLNLRYDPQAQAWLLTDHDFLWLSWLGNCSMDNKTKIVDTLDNGKHKSLRKCFEAHEPVMGYVEVVDGIVKNIEITDVFE